MTSSQEELKSSLKIFLELGDADPLEETIAAFPDLCGELVGEYPDLHRIADIRIGESCFRVCRKTSCNERITLVPIEEAIDTITGVPLWLEGEQLRRWVQHESSEPTKGPTDWTKYQ